jgi:hypothetical protein
VKPFKNVTLSLPEPLLRRFRVFAAERNQSMTGVMAEAIRRMMDEDTKSSQARRRFLERLKNPPGRSAHGKITWTREELHERGDTGK